MIPLKIEKSQASKLVCCFSMSVVDWKLYCLIEKNDVGFFGYLIVSGTILSVDREMEYQDVSKMGRTSST